MKHKKNSQTTNKTTTSKIIYIYICLFCAKPPFFVCAHKGVNLDLDLNWFWPNLISYFSYMNLLQS